MRGLFSHVQHAVYSTYLLNMSQGMVMNYSQTSFIRFRTALFRLILSV